MSSAMHDDMLAFSYEIILNFLPHGVLHVKIVSDGDSDPPFLLFILLQEFTTAFRLRRR